MADADDMVNITQRKLQKFVCQDTSSISKAEQGVIRENSSQAHCPRVEDRLMAETAQTCMAMYNLDLLPDDYVSEDWKEGEHCREGRGSIYDQKRYVINLETVCKISNTSPSFVRVCYYDHFMPSVYEFCRELVYMTLDSAWLRKEEVTDHSNVVGHLDRNRLEHLFRRRANVLSVKITLRQSTSLLWSTDTGKLKGLISLPLSEKLRTSMTSSESEAVTDGKIFLLNRLSWIYPTSPNKVRKPPLPNRVRKQLLPKQVRETNSAA